MVILAVGTTLRKHSTLQIQCHMLRAVVCVCMQYLRGKRSSTADIWLDDGVLLNKSSQACWLCILDSYTQCIRVLLCKRKNSTIVSNSIIRSALVDGNIAASTGLQHTQFVTYCCSTHCAMTAHSSLQLSKKEPVWQSSNSHCRLLDAYLSRL
jgi:hypothetical protein